MWNLGVKWRMQKLLIIFAVLGLLTSSCKKTNEISGIKRQLNGTWEITRSYGGWSGEREYSPGNGNTLTFNQDGTFIGKVVSADTSFTVTGTYEVYVDKPCYYEKDTTLISFSNGEVANVLSVTSNELGIADSPCIADGGSNYYRKIR